MQTWVVKKIAGNLSDKLKTEVRIRKVNFKFLNTLEIDGLLIKDRQQDTLIFADKLKANVTDWFIFKDRVELKNIQMQDAVVNMHRSDSVWNYQFLIEFFKKPKTNKQNSDLNLDLREVHFTNIRFNKVDEWFGQNLISSVKKLDVITDSINFNTGNIALQSVRLQQPSFWQENYDGNEPEEKDNAVNVMGKIPVVGVLRWNLAGIDLSIKDVVIIDGAFKSDKDRGNRMQQFDGRHVFFNGINGTLKNLTFVEDTLRGLVDIKAKEISGFQVKKLQASLRVTPEIMEFSNLDLHTNKSKLGDYFSMEYKAFLSDFPDFVHKVVMTARFKPSNIHSDDLAFFGPAMKTWKRNFSIEGNARGTVDNFTATALKVRSGATYLDGRISMRGLPDINTTFIDFASKSLQTNYDELARLLPELQQSKTPAFYKLGSINYKGNFTGFTNDFVAYGTLQTGMGTLTTDINMKLPKGKDPIYSGTINTDRFNLGGFLLRSDLGYVALEGRIEGRGFSQAAVNATVEGKVKYIDYNNYHYQNLAVKGNFNSKLFKGNLSINDPNLKISELDGELNLSSSKPFFNLNASVQEARLQRLGFLSKDVRLSGLFALNFEGSNIDNFLGTASIENASLSVDSTRLSFDSLRLTSKKIGEIKELELSSNELKATLTGKFNILDLPNSFTAFLHKYYPVYIPAPNRGVAKQDFKFDIKTYNVEQYLKIFAPRLSGFNSSEISGSINTDANELDLVADVPRFGYDEKVFTNTILTGKGNSDTLYATVQVADIKLNDSMHFPGTKISLKAHDDVSLVNLSTRANKTLEDAELNASVKTFNDGVGIHFFPSSFVLNNRRWNLEKDGELTLRKNFIDASEVKFVQGNQVISIHSELDDVSDGMHLVAELQNVIIEDFSPFITTSPTLAGRLNGRATLSDVYGDSRIIFTGRADSLAVEGEYVGTVRLQADANLKRGLVDFAAKAMEKDYNFDVSGNFNYKDSIDDKLNLDFNANAFNIKLLEPFLGTVFSKMQGLANGNIKIVGGKNPTRITGSTIISDGMVEVAYTKVKYMFNDEELIFGRNYLDLGKMLLRDTLGNVGNISGRMYHTFFKDISFQNMNFQTNKMILLNTTRADNEQFYGYAIGNATMSLNGPITDLQMKIDGEPSRTDSSHIYIPTGETAESNTVDYIDFIQFGSEMATKIKRNEEANFTLDMNLVANPATKVDVILDEETGDIIKGQGNGRLNIRVGTTEPLRISGRYEITKGEYVFNFQTFLKKPFFLNEGTITWNGDPFEASINLKAEYLAKNVDISSLSSFGNAGSLNSGIGTKTDVTILSTLTGSLLKPIIKFEFKLPELSESSRDYLVIKRLDEFKNDENQMLNQVASLLLFNSFISNDQSFISQQNTLSIGTNFIGGIISNWLTGVLNKELEKATKGIISTYIDVNPTLNLQATANTLQANIRGGVKLLLSKRLIFYAGGNYDTNQQLSVFTNGTGLNADFTLEWLLNSDGTLRVVGFKKTSVDLTIGLRNRTGVQLSYRRDVNKLGDLFKSRKKLAEEAARDSVN